MLWLGVTAVTRVLQLWLDVTAVSWCCRVDDVSEKYSQLEDEFRLALHVEAKRFTEVPAPRPPRPASCLCKSYKFARRVSQFGKHFFVHLCFVAGCLEVEVYEQCSTDTNLLSTCSHTS